MKELVGTQHGGEVEQKTKAFGYLLTWNALLSKIEQGRIKATLQDNLEYQKVLNAVSEYLEDNAELY